jgi:RNA polymerase sigma-70 factor, ECF subfamily
VPTPSPHEVIRLLLAWSEGEQEALEKLIPLVHEELQRLAHRYLSRTSVVATLCRHLW